MCSSFHVHTALIKHLLMSFFPSLLDKAAFLYGKKLEITGQTNQLVTKGRGGPKCKDALLSIVVNRN